MRITFNSQYKSVKKFEFDGEIPRFTLITGLNGSGKTHFLEAIAQGYLRATPLQEPAKIVYFNLLSLIPAEGDAASHDGRIENRHRIIQIIRQFKKGNGFIKHSETGLSINRTEIHRQLFTSLGYVNLDDKDEIEFLFHEAKKLRQGVDLFSLSEEEIGRLPLFSREELFSRNLIREFSSYRDLWLKNEIAKHRRSRGEQIEYLDSEPFIQLNGAAPWEMLNENFKTCGFKFRVSEPDRWSFSQYKPKLTKLSGEKEVSLSDLSSGEKIIAALLIALYDSREKSRNRSFGNSLVLLDEIDAVLHPSMARIYIDFVTKSLVQDLQIHVIAATHSASTVALAPDESIYTIAAGDNGPELKKETKASALNLLTAGVPILSVSYEGRRQVFVESDNDAKLYSELYSILRTELNSERSLEFVGTGIRDKNDNEIHSGRSVVETLVRQLSERGNKSVYGLVDWDGHSKEEGNLKVLACGRRYSIENVLLDPLVLIAALIDTDPNMAKEIGLNANDTFVSLPNCCVTKLQDVVTKVDERVIGQIETSSEVKYLNFTLNVSDKYLSLNGHNLEEKILKAFPKLKKHKNEGLKWYIVSKVLKNHTCFIPIEIIDAFNSLLAPDSH